nr:EOG090X06CC [Triops cancriformis]
MYFVYVILLSMNTRLHGVAKRVVKAFRNEKNNYDLGHTNSVPMGSLSTLSNAMLHEPEERESISNRKPPQLLRALTKEASSLSIRAASRAMRQKNLQVAITHNAASESSCLAGLNERSTALAAAQPLSSSAPSSGSMGNAAFPLPGSTHSVPGGGLLGRSSFTGAGQGQGSQGLQAPFGMPLGGSSMGLGLDGGLMPSTLDLSEFPSLTNRMIDGLGSNSTSLSARSNYVGIMKAPSAEPTEFTMSSEDFPALPGTQLSLDSSQSNGQDSKPATNATTTTNSKRGLQTSPDGKVTNIPSGMVTDQFGMVGLLTFIRVAETDSNLVSLALGSDLTTLGLNLNSPESLYANFGGPWAEHPCRPQDIDFHVPPEYLTNSSIKEKLAPMKLNRYQEDLLFYLFYTYVGDVLQLAAAAELYNRDWRYHKEERVWITRAPGMPPLEKTSTYERGTYYCFDPHNWRKVAKEFYVEYDKLEDRPQFSSAMIPPTSTMQPV